MKNKKKLKKNKCIWLIIFLMPLRKLIFIIRPNNCKNIIKTAVNNYTQSESIYVKYNARNDVNTNI